ncbi:MAG: hypothetical protein KAJ42_14820, partial [Gemmatimonadetes bacterium]|nr:hypothetical protein [Gemmatimonadota bacterium]
MNKTLLVTRHEFLTTLRRRSYQVVSFGLPLLGVGILFVVTLVRGGSGTEGPAEDPNVSTALRTEGFVDKSGLIEIVPDDLPLVRFADETAAKEALDAGE